MLSLLQKDNARPRKRKGLEGKLKSWLPLMQDEERAGFLERLFADRPLHIKFKPSAGTLIDPLRQPPQETSKQTVGTLKQGMV